MQIFDSIASIHTFFSFYRRFCPGVQASMHGKMVVMHSEFLLYEQLKLLPCKYMQDSQDYEISCMHGNIIALLFC